MPVIGHMKPQREGSHLASTLTLTVVSKAPEPPDRVTVRTVEGQEAEYVALRRAERAEALLERIAHADDRHADYWTHEISRVLDAR